jgi:hypothetical protein
LFMTTIVAAKGAANRRENRPKPRKNIGC